MEMHFVAAQHATVQNYSLAKQDMAVNILDEAFSPQEPCWTAFSIRSAWNRICAPSLSGDTFHGLGRLQCNFREVELYCKSDHEGVLLQAASIGVSLCQSVSGVAAPSTSQHQSVSCMLQGAC